MNILDDLKLQYKMGGFEQKIIYWNCGIFLLSIIFFYQFRLGKFEKTNIEFFDMMLDVGPNPSLEELIKQIDYYIKKL